MMYSAATGSLHSDVRDVAKTQTPTNDPRKEKSHLPKVEQNKGETA